jgi:hypothetical protein
MINPTTNPIEDARALKDELSKIIGDFTQRTNYVVTDIDILARSQRINTRGQSLERIVEGELRKLSIQGSRRR